MFAVFNYIYFLYKKKDNTDPRRCVEARQVLPIHLKIETLFKFPL